MSTRPCFLVVDQEHASSLSTRKLVLETAKYNVITAYSCQEAIEHLQRFPRIDAIVVNASAPDSNGARLLAVIHDMPEVKLVVVGEGPMAQGERYPDAVVEGFSPAKLLEALQVLFPAESRQLLEREETLEREQI